MERSFSQNRFNIITAWCITLLVSILPQIIAKELFHDPAIWAFRFKLAVLAAALFMSVFWLKARPLLKYILVLAVLFLLEYFAGLIGAASFWQIRFHGTDFVTSMMSTQLLRLIVSAGMVMVMLTIQHRGANFFLTKGDLNAAADPIPFIMTKPTRWSRLGWILAGCITGGTLVFLFLGSRGSSSQWAQFLPIFLMVLLFALMNSFSEEMNYRASLLSVLEEPVGKNQSMLLTAVFFGIGHYYGVPYGIIGVIMASLLGWLLGKSMLETRGFAWAWFIHFLQDVAIFSFMALGSIIPGG